MYDRTLYALLRIPRRVRILNSVVNLDGFPNEFVHKREAIFLWEIVQISRQAQRVIA